MRGWAGTGREGVRGVSLFRAPRCCCPTEEAACGRSVGEGRALRAAGRAVAGAWCLVEGNGRVLRARLEPAPDTARAAGVPGLIETLFVLQP